MAKKIVKEAAGVAAVFQVSQAKAVTQEDYNKAWAGVVGAPGSEGVFGVDMAREGGDETAVAITKDGKTEFIVGAEADALIDEVSGDEMSYNAAWRSSIVDVVGEDVVMAVDGAKGDGEVDMQYLFYVITTLQEKFNALQNENERLRISRDYEIAQSSPDYVKQKNELDREAVALLVGGLEVYEEYVQTIRDAPGNVHVFISPAEVAVEAAKNWRELAVTKEAVAGGEVGYRHPPTYADFDADDTTHGSIDKLKPVC